MNDQPSITVITVVRNASNTIERCIKSVLSQNIKDIEYIVIDGASTDGTLDIVNKYSASISKIISEPDRGIYDAMNKGIRQASGKWIHLLNADDHYVDNTVLSRAVSQLVKDKTNYLTLLRELDGVAKGEYRFPYNEWRMHLSAKLPHPAMIIAREQYEKIGLYDSGLRIAADHDLILRMLKHYPPHFIDFPLVAMDQSGVSASNLKATYHEFMEVTIRHGLPRPIAWCIYWIKRLRWGVFA